MNDLAVGDLVYICGEKLQMCGRIGIIINIDNGSMFPIMVEFPYKFLNHVSYQYYESELIKIGQYMNNLKVGDIVFMIRERLSMKWQVGKIIKIYSGRRFTFSINFPNNKTYQYSMKEFMKIGQKINNLKVGDLVFICGEKLTMIGKIGRIKNITPETIFLFKVVFSSQDDFGFYVEKELIKIGGIND